MPSRSHLLRRGMARLLLMSLLLSIEGCAVTAFFFPSPSTGPAVNCTFGAEETVFSWGPVEAYTDNEWDPIVVYFSPGDDFMGVNFVFRMGCNTMTQWLSREALCIGKSPLWSKFEFNPDFRHLLLNSCRLSAFSKFHYFSHRFIRRFRNRNSVMLSVVAWGALCWRFTEPEGVRIDMNTNCSCFSRACEAPPEQNAPTLTTPATLTIPATLTEQTCTPSAFIVAALATSMVAAAVIGMLVGFLWHRAVSASSAGSARRLQQDQDTTHPSSRLPSGHMDSESDYETPKHIYEYATPDDLARDRGNPNYMNIDAEALPSLRHSGSADGRQITVGRNVIAPLPSNIYMNVSEVNAKPSIP